MSWFEERPPPVWFGAWRAVAERLGGHVAHDRGFTAVEDKVLMTAPVGGTTVRATTAPYARRFAAPVELEAPAPAAGPFVLSVYPAGRALRAAARKVFRIPDVEVGDTSFDEAFVVQTNDVVLARAWLSPELIRWINAAGNIDLHLGRQAVHAEVPGPLDDAARVDTIVRVVALLARGAEPLAHAWAAAARTLGAAAHGPWSVDGGAPIPLTIGGAEVTVDARWWKRRLHTIATTPSRSDPRTLSDGDLEVTVGADDTTVAVRGLETRPEVLHRLARRAADAAGGRDGDPTPGAPYR